MSDSFGFVVFVAAAWLAIGLVLSIVMGRRGHSSFGWLVMGALLGPLAIVLAIDAQRHDEGLTPRPLASGSPATAGSGPVDVLVGYDGSPDSAGAVEAVVELLGDRLGRLMVATIVPYGEIREPERLASERLRRLPGGKTGRAPELEILHGHPSTALRQCAIDEGYDLIAVGTRGKGLTKAMLGSAASELARDSKVPVLLVGGR